MYQSRYGMEKSWQIAQRIWEAELTPTQKLVALCILSHRRSETGHCFPSRARIAKMCGLSLLSVKRSLKVLREAGIVETVDRMGRFCLFSFPVPDIVNLRVMGDQIDTLMGFKLIPNDTPDGTPVGLSQSEVKSIFAPHIGENMEDER